MTLWEVNLFIGIVNMVLFFLNADKATRRMHYRYPELHFRKVTWTDKALVFIKKFFVSFCPILNIGILGVLIFRDEQLCESAINEAYKLYKKENEHDQS